MATHSLIYWLRLHEPGRSMLLMPKHQLHLTIVQYTFTLWLLVKNGMSRLKALTVNNTNWSA